MYRYYSKMEYAVESLEKRTVYFSSPSQFNDPFDELYKVRHIGSNSDVTIRIFQKIIKYLLTNELYLQEYIDSISFEGIGIAIDNNEVPFSMTIQDAVKKFLDITELKKISCETIVNAITRDYAKPEISINDNSLKICCFSKNNDSIPMWAYYGGSHSGICIEYDTSLLSDNIKQHIHDIEYLSERSENDVHFKKSEAWKHENELRIILSDIDINKNELDFDCITGVFLGNNYDFSDNPQSAADWKCPKEFINKQYTYYRRIIAAIKSMDHNVTLYKTDIDNEKYKLNFKEIYNTKK